MTDTKRTSHDIIKYFSISLLLIALIVFSFVYENNEKSMFAYFIDVGQGDCTLFVCDNKSLMIDTGDSKYGDTVIRKLDELSIDSIDTVIITHPHSDHMGALYDIIENKEIKNIIISDCKPEEGFTDKYYEILDIIEKKQIKLLFYDYENVYKIGDMNFRFLKLFKNYENINDNSLITVVSFGKNNILMMGDAEETEEKNILKYYNNLACNVIKIGHHGSDSSSSREFINAVEPEIAVISVGKNNQYGFPTADTLNNLSEINCKTYRTDLEGDILIKFDFISYEVIK